MNHTPTPVSQPSQEDQGNGPSKSPRPPFRTYGAVAILLTVLGFLAQHAGEFHFAFQTGFRP